MDRDVGTIFAIKALGYPSSVCVRQCGCDELPCQLLTWLVSELKTICPEMPERRVGSAVLVGELRDMLREMFCPYTALTTETLSPALLNKVTEFLVSELQAAHMMRYRADHPEDTQRVCELEKEQREKKGSVVEIEEESEECGQGEGDQGGAGKEEIEKELALLYQALDMDASSQISDACTQVESHLALMPEGDIPKPLLKTSLNSTQWKKLQQIHQALSKDYDCRRQMMIKRFHVTLQSFAWGEKGKERSAAVSSIPSLSPSSLESCVSVALLLAAREDQSRILPVRAGPSTAVHKVLMGSVPDRGGRPGEIEPPMPTWSGRSEGGGRRGHGGGRGRGQFQRREYSGKKKKDKKNRRGEEETLS